MRNKSRFFVLPLALVMAFMMLMAFAACGESSSNGDDTGDNSGTTVESEYEFEFTGSTVIADSTYNVTVYGNKDETISLRVKELPVAELEGTWVYVEGKGYKIYFDDTNGSYVYTKYDTSTKQFSFTYELNLGDTNGGSGKVYFTYSDESFATKYDGVGLGNVPPTFTGYTTYIGAMFALGEPVKCLLTCYEDGTCSSVSTNEVKFAATRNGTWSYDDDTNQYTFTFDEEPFSVSEEGSSYWQFTQEVGVCSLEEAAEHWTFFDGGTCYWESVTITETPTNTFTTVYDEESNTYYLLYEHGFNGFGEFAERYVAWSPED